MKTTIVVIGTVLICVTVKAQTFNEWFRQKKTQLKYLGQQIAALQGYARALEQGYAIAHDGLSLISHIKQGDFLLHSDYFSSLRSVNPKVAAYSKIPEIMVLQTSILKQCSQIRTLTSSSFLSENRSYYHAVLNQLVDGCDATLGELIDVLMADRLQLTDDERMTRIDQVYETMKDRYRFIRHFHSEVALLLLQAKKERSDAAGVRLLYK